MLALVINTFNQPDYLRRVLAAVSAQTAPPAEVLLADDGSADETRRAFEEWSRGRVFSTAHVWQPHEGFRRARVLNQAIARVASDYTVFLDGDTVPHPAFVADHQALARPGAFIQGHRALVKESAARWFGAGSFAADRRRAFWTAQLQGLKHCYRWPAPSVRPRSDLRGIRGCNLAIWRADLLRANGYNEAFTGWGREDSELATRLMNAGVRRLDVRGRALCFHLWHPPAARADLERNDGLLAAAQAAHTTRCERGLTQYLPAR